MMLPVDIHVLIGRGIRARREALGLRQEEAAQKFRFFGLPTWRRSTVAQVEAGTRRPSLGDLLIVSYALGCALADLVPEVNEPVDLGTGATIGALGAKKLLSDWDAFGKLPVEEALEGPGSAMLTEATQRAKAEEEKQKPLLRPIWENSPRPLGQGDRWQAQAPPTEAEVRAAERLDVLPVQLKAASRVLWGKNFEEERDVRAEVGSAAPQSLQARRGHATRRMLSELRAFLDDVLPGATQTERRGAQRPETSMGEAHSQIMYLTVRETAHLLRLSPKDVDGLVTSGELPAIRVGKNLRIPEPAVRDQAERSAATVEQPSPSEDA